MYLFSLSEKLNELDFGGKASGLSKINSLKLLIPKGYGIVKQAHEHYKLNGEIHPDLVKELESKLPELLVDKIIVRSSAIGEDGDDYSFAGQLDSFVVDNNIQAVCEGIAKCWDSLHGERIIAYQSISSYKIRGMGVVIQRYIAADYSGVLFTKSPKNGKHIYCEYVKGGSEPLVSGRVTPKSFSTDMHLNVSESVQLPFNYKKLINQALLLKENFSKHLDIEWIYKAGEFYFVQARPINNVEKDISYWTNTNLNENYPGPISPLLYSIAKDSYYHYFKNLTKLLHVKEGSIRRLEYDFNNVVGIFGNRIYYNMTSIHNIIGASPYQSYFQDAFNKFVGYKDKVASSKAFNRKTSGLKTGIRLLSLNISLDSHVIQIEKEVDAFSQKVSNAKGLRTLSFCFHEFLDLRFHQWYHASLADLFSMLYYKLLANFVKRIYGAKYTGVQNTLIQAIPNIISNKPLQASWDIIQEISTIPKGKEFFTYNDSKYILNYISRSSDWQQVHFLIQEYLNRWGFRCSGELMLTKDNYIDSPTALIELLQTYITCGEKNPKIAISKMLIEQRKLMKKTAIRIIRRRHILFPLAAVEIVVLFSLTHLCRKAILSRERVRYKQAQMYYNFKKTIFQIGDIFKRNGIIHQQKDILFLRYQEIGSLLSSSDMLTDTYSRIISIRKKEYESESLLKYPTSFEQFGNEKPDFVADNQTKIIKGKVHDGLAASGGIVRAKVKLLESVFEIQKLKHGEILVTKQTDPGWAMAFPIIGGLIAEKGGVLSHGAIVAREFGIPAVVGIEGITEYLKDNDEVILDGNLGRIQIL